MARPKKSTTRHKLDGTYRADRHATTTPPPDKQDRPIRPRHLKRYARQMWDYLAPHFERYEAARVDTAIVVATCHTWQLYRDALAIATKEPTDRNARAAVVAYLDQWHRLAAKLGATPADRSRLLPTEANAPITVATRPRP